MYWLEFLVMDSYFPNSLSLDLSRNFPPPTIHWRDEPMGGHCGYNRFICMRVSY